jgi:hypothetical protein
VVKTGTNEEGCRAYHYGGDQHAREFPNISISVDPDRAGRITFFFHCL